MALNGQLGDVPLHPLFASLYAAGHGTAGVEPPLSTPPDPVTADSPHGQDRAPFEPSLITQGSSASKVGSDRFQQAHPIHPKRKLLNCFQSLDTASNPKRAEGCEPVLAKDKDSPSISGVPSSDSLSHSWAPFEMPRTKHRTIRNEELLSVPSGLAAVGPSHATLPNGDTIHQPPSNMSKDIASNHAASPALVESHSLDARSDHARPTIRGLGTALPGITSQRRSPRNLEDGNAAKLRTSLPLLRPGRGPVRQARIISSTGYEKPKNWVYIRREGGRLIIALKYEACTNPIKEGIVKVLNPPHISSTSEGSIQAASESPQQIAKPVHPFFLAKPRVQGRDSSGRPTPSSSHVDATIPSDRSTSSSDVDQQDPLLQPICGSSRSKPQSQLVTPTAPKSSARIGATPRTEAPHALWPPRDLTHVRGLSGLEASQLQAQATAVAEFPADMGFFREKRQKGAAIRITEEENLLRRFASRLAESLKSTADIPMDGSETPSLKELRVPDFLALKRKKLQRLVRSEVHSTLSSRKPRPPDTSHDAAESPPCEPTTSHPALLSVFDYIGNSVTAFDMACCETQLWVQKYAPKSARECLQMGQEAVVLRDWLQDLRLHPEAARSSGRNPAPTIGGARTTNKHHLKKRSRPKPRRKRPDDLDGFVLLSGDESEDAPLSTLKAGGAYPPAASGPNMSEIISAPSTKPGERPLNAILLSGPCGCGKSAAVYAVAKELDFEVFEINAGVRRSGKDLLDKVGDMSRNHLVRRSHDSQSETSSDKDEDSKHCMPSEVSSADAVQGDSYPPRTMLGKKRTRRSGEDASLAAGSSPTIASEAGSAPANLRERRHQKNSLIFLEEVDILFEEDRQFWTTLLSLLSQSKRPIIMTCNDETLIPLEAIPLHRILRFQPPSVTLATDYLLLVAAAEGHLLSRPAVEALYKSKKHDLRASIMELEFWCQMAVGDRKGGLDWMIDKHNSDESGRMVSKQVACRGSYLPGMGWSSHDAVVAHAGEAGVLEEILTIDAWENWEIDIEDWAQDEAFMPPFLHSGNDGEQLASDVARAHCTSLHVFYAALSDADVYSCHALASGCKVPLDATQPRASERWRLDAVQGHCALEAEPRVDDHRLSTDIALASKVFAKRKLEIDSTSVHQTRPAHCSSLDEASFVRLVVGRRGRLVNSGRILQRSAFSAAFRPISEVAGPGPGTSASGVLHASDFDRALRLVAEDLAPYTRMIVRSDQRVEEERRRLDELAAEGGRGGKRVRTTRASRSALEGADRSRMRRDRWFDCSLDPALVFSTGSEAWLRAASERGYC